MRAEGDFTVELPGTPRPQDRVVQVATGQRHVRGVRAQIDEGILPPFRLVAAPMPELKDGQTLPPYQNDGPVWIAEPTGKSGFDTFFKK